MLRPKVTWPTPSKIQEAQVGVMPAARQVVTSVGLRLPWNDRQEVEGLMSYPGQGRLARLREHRDPEMQAREPKDKWKPRQTTSCVNWVQTAIYTLLANHPT